MAVAAGAASGAVFVERVHISGPALSQQIIALEGELGTESPFVRDRRSVRSKRSRTVFRPRRRALTLPTTPSIGYSGRAGAARRGARGCTLQSVNPTTLNKHGRVLAVVLRLDERHPVVARESTALCGRGGTR